MKMNPSKISADGFLTSLAEKVMSGDMERGNKLSTSQLERIATLLGHLSKQGNLYDILFNESNQRVTLDNTTINTKDLMWFVLMDHSYARGWYWQPTGKMTADTSVCAGVPLAFLGARRLYNKPYMSWLTDLGELHCDMFLPQGLNSWKIDDEGQVVHEESNSSRGGAAGLIRVFNQEDMHIDLAHIHRLREEVPRYTSTSKPKKVIPSNISEDERVGNLYNNCSYLMRCMILQGWCWYNLSRNEDMILDFTSWDNNLPSIDSMSHAMQGLAPKDTRIAKGFLAFTKTKEEDLLNLSM